MITVHHLNNSRSHRILWLLEELEVPYEFKSYQRNPKTMQAPDSLKKIHPLGLSPVITDGEVTVAESGAIIEYILFHYGKERLKPLPGTKAWNNYNNWMHYAEGTFMPLLFVGVIFDNVHHHLPFFIKPVFKTIKAKVKAYFLGPRITAHMDYMETTLKNQQWFCGDEFSAADIQIATPLLWIAEDNRSIENRPKIADFIARIQKRPAFIKALEKGGDCSRAKIGG